ncbi:hypothetical protein D9M72_633540 [compost metagenome]
MLLKPWMSFVTPLRLTVPLVTPPAAIAVVVVPLVTEVPVADVVVTLPAPSFTVRPVVLSTL